MDIAIIFLITAGIIIIALVAINAFLLWKARQTNEKIDNLLEKGKIKDFKDIFLSQKEKIGDLEEKIREAFLKIKNLEDISETTIRRVGVVRFNPFNNMGGNQSFVIALLDNKNNGFVISSLFVKEGNRVYAKVIKGGKSDHVLSGEEVEAVSRATSSK
ncbi:MAG: DUF4446 family protein [Candidatus Staskawiczbacteria bacterium]|nr:DUF4446 family protein [Candidatus Staskawiczbacteria bacterium]